jgi:reactive intermediate/imine deaminase
MIQVSGQVAVDPATGELDTPGDVRAQTRRVLENVRAVLKAGGASFEDVLMVRVFLTSGDDFAAMNEAYAAFMATHVPSGQVPCRTTVIVGLPRPELLVEIDVLAVAD